MQNKRHGRKINTADREVESHQDPPHPTLQIDLLSLLCYAEDTCLKIRQVVTAQQFEGDYGVIADKVYE